MPYATQALLTERFSTRMLVNLTDRGDVATGTVNATIVARAVADTVALIDGHIRARYALPLAATPPMLVDLALTIAIYKLHTHQPDPKIAEDYWLALKTLAQIARGEVQLDLAGAEPATQNGGGVRATDRERPMT